MRLVAFQSPHGPGIGLRTGDEVTNLTAAGLPATIEQLLATGADWQERVRDAARRAQGRLELGTLRLLPPIAAPAKALAVGLNYHAHAQETRLDPGAAFPVLFPRYPSSWVAHGEPLLRPAGARRYDYEGELVAVIGRAGRHIPLASALGHVAGYSIFNDGTERDLQFLTSQWLAGKNFDASGAFGPEFVSADELSPGAVGLRLRTVLNGTTVQDADTRDMIFDVAALVHACSRVMRLVPGDLLITGTPAGVGMSRQPPLYLQPGDLCEVQVEGIGTLSNRIAAEPGAPNPQPTDPRTPA